jgi:hypothetical protein
MLRELISREFEESIDADSVLWSVLCSAPRFSWKNFRKIINTNENIRDEEIDEFRKKLSKIPIQIDKNKPIFLLNDAAGIQHSEWNNDFKLFISSLQNINSENIEKFRSAISDLFENYRNAYGIDFVISDIANPNRISLKVNYVKSKFINIKDKDEFISLFSSDMLAPNNDFNFQTIVRDVYNWPAALILDFFGLGSVQHIATKLPIKFSKKYNHSIRPYAYMNGAESIVRCLLSGMKVGQFFSKGVQFNEDEFYTVIWPLFAECIWEEIRDRKPLDENTVELMHRYKKCMRIISSPDLEPISYLLMRSMPSLEDGPTLRGVFNQLSSQSGWSKAALTTETTGLDPLSRAVIQTQAVFGRKHISDKTRELAGRMRSVFLRCDQNGLFIPEMSPGLHLAVLDGDWPIESKINLLEAGFFGLFEIAELDRLTVTLESLLKQ